jgi:hypothetical protein
VNDINLLMSRMDEINAKSAEQLTPDDITTVITFHRQQRARRAAGEKAPKPSSSPIDISAILGAITPTKPVAEVFKRKL